MNADVVPRPSCPPRAPIRVALYSHDTFGLGHFSRCVKIARALSTGLGPVEGIFITGQPHTGLLTVPPGYRCVRLPAVTKCADGNYAARDAGTNLAAVVAERRRLITDAIGAFGPDLLIVDNVPCGLRREIVPALRHRAAQPNARTVLALRDVLDEPDAVRHEWERDGADEALQMYDEIWVFGDAGDADTLVAEGPLSRVASKVIACGALGSSVEPRSNGSACRVRPNVIVTTGGGADGDVVVRHYLDALRRFRPQVSSRIVLGPDFARRTQRELTSHNGFDASIERSALNFGSRFASADVVVSMAGYNTVCEVRAAGAAALLVPRVRPRREQWIRAEKLAASGRAKVLHPDTINPRSLWRAVEELLEMPLPVPEALTGGRKAMSRAAWLLGAECAGIFQPSTTS